ncbi:efflux RND transporter periplasmic adaptor subunit [Hellea balneolensis]|uniref:efflux RND transporter periplasmic adaptor subunit n=1 Tax=Hellea balneolensis TaxID=287478 RepID=UPI00040BDF62|nr:efflux RND transporter periplasmic adaptor subunit [Hellea balneolensis]
MTDSHNARTPSGAGETLPHSAREKAERKRLWIWRALIFVLPVLVIGGAIGGFAAMGALKPTPEEKEDVVKAIPVLTAIATQDDVTLKVNVQGEVQPRTQINIVPQISGLITYMSPKFIEGGRFKKGDLLVRIDSAEFELRVTQAKASVAQAETVVTREISESNMARRDWEELGRVGNPTPLTLREPQMAEAKAQLASAQARLAETELQLNRTSLYAPFTGRVTMRHVDQGEFVTAGTKLGEIYATNLMDVRLPMTNAELRRAGLSLGFEASGKTAGIPVTLSADVAGTFSEWQGRIVRTDSRFDSKTRVLYAYAEVRDPFVSGASNGVPLAPGLFVNAAVKGQKLENMIVIPRAALRGEDKVYIAKGDTLSIMTVNVMSSNKDEAILGGGIEIGDAVITSPIRGVADGMKIQVVKTSANTATSTSTEGEP